MSREVHVGFCEQPRGRCPWLTHPVVHCRTQAEAETLKAAIAGGLEQCGLELHPQKTKIVYCRDANRTKSYVHCCFDFLGFCFRPRLSRNRQGQYFVNFSPAISPKSKKSIYAEIRQWRLHLKSGSSWKDLAGIVNPAVRGWIEYYGAFFRSELHFLVHHIDGVIYRWVIRKFKKRGANYKKAKAWVQSIKDKAPGYFAHWQLLGV